MSSLSRAAVRRTLALAAAVLVAASALATPASAADQGPTGTITGRVLLEGTPDKPAAAGTEVLLRPTSTSEVKPLVVATTDAAGAFEAAVVPDETYTVSALVEDGLHVQRNLGSDRPNAAGTVFSVSAGKTLALPEYVLPLGATISGHVDTDDGVSVPVTAFNRPPYGSYVETRTDANGDYTIRGLDLDFYNVSFDDRTGDPKEWWPNSPTQDGAARIVITSLDQAVTGIDADLRTARANPLDSAPCLDRSTLTVAKATAAARAYLRSHDLDALKTLTRADVKQYLARCA
ncbi:carboxypeptidase-like regulatory domain-containing protein [Rathayibacter festucae]|uniref:carboxypeptidase-like regulatory domain-containing protein n=1 Tax=Rathayibacter festucae TaxID=110937 RepID=UPI001FB34056|nr:carboxypeptidase-like regulatory domain-containing protein [Rathayibacter festucae]MCJ1700344.1 carboxypeptidase-like regulatory domain-containing protein [Rathayibacter festucae]